MTVLRYQKQQLPAAISSTPQVYLLPASSWHPTQNIPIETPVPGTVWCSQPQWFQLTKLKFPMLSSYFVAKALTQQDSLGRAAKSSQDDGKAVPACRAYDRKTALWGKDRNNEHWRGPAHPRACKQCSNPTFSTTSRKLTRSARSDIEKQRNTYTKRLHSHTVKTFAFLYDTFSCRSQCSKVMLGFSSTYIISILHQNISSLLFRCDLMLIGGYYTRLSTIVSPGVLAHRVPQPSVCATAT